LIVSALLIATGLILMLDGHVLGERTVGVASVIGLMGIILMLMSAVRVAMQKDQQPAMYV
jgi:hypothetical protein